MTMLPDTTTTPPLPRHRDRAEALIATADLDRSAPAQADSSNVERLLAESDPGPAAAWAEGRSPQEHRDGYAFDDGDAMARAAATGSSNKAEFVEEASKENVGERGLDATMIQASSGEHAGEEEYLNWSSDDPLAPQKAAQHLGQLDSLISKLNPLRKDRYTGQNQRPRDTDGDGVPDYADKDTNSDGLADANQTDEDGDGVPDHSDADADGDGIPDAKQTDLTDANGNGTPDFVQQTTRSGLEAALADTPPATRLDLWDVPDTRRRDGTGPAWQPPEKDSYSARVKRMVKPEYQGNGPATMPRSFSSRRGGRGRHDMRGR